MLLTVFLLAILFVAGLINVFFFLPTSKLFAWIQSFIFPASISCRTTSTPSLSQEQKERSSKRKTQELRQIFATFDKNSDGFITKQELRESLKNIRIFMTDRDLEEMVVKVDSNGDGLIDFDEFCLLCESLISRDAAGQSSGKGGGEEEEEEEGEELKEAFDVFDKDKDGLISVEELGLVLCSLGLKEGNKIEDCKEMIKKVDMDGDGMVNFDEFKKMMKGGGSVLLKSN
ncbi:calmodulin-like protein 3 isoform X1 [Ziziphus jujuba]|uniref:Calmodulin-like protein 3 isoform X1 n=1 Tax=Ziziphus jujuba TaxID=326968 RepID=A0ABM3ZV82_ZIZJJ|nr:calmodulin-like protein 3 isoform X1 [Ziziphus jujuba]XP_060668388.1 calmodulin-like protein 3 isoform X1 [Ziziphus jujuba]XP_060668389.1 calmodulin-like protein 3 isoform X1 [Ziziphus jujuba]XP_060668390.1 calmodulin-like protein 3 isoform X1 [Ziziphus jujuba]XP_060668391.1 calmodulin-like protein 3 isoform X1 [Ziziphus jujuba]